MQLSDWLSKWQRVWCASRKPATLASYQDITSRLIIPAIGHLELADIVPEDVQAILNDQLTSGNYRQAQLVYAVLHAALRRAVRSRHLSENPCDALDKPSHRAKQARALTADEMATVKAAGVRDPYWCGLALMLYAGLRRGEAIALHWSDVDLPGRKLVIQRNAVLVNNKLTVGLPKSDAGLREVPICNYLADVLTAQRKQLLRAGRAGSDRPVAPGRDGGYVSPTCLRSHAKQIFAAAGVPPTTLHGLRRSFGTRASQMGLKPKSLQAILGHSTPDISMRLYNEAQTCYIVSDFNASCAFL